MNKALFKTGIIGGIGAAIFCFLYIFLLYQLGLNPFGRYKYLYFGFYGIFFAGTMWYFRDKQNGYRLKGIEGILIGFTLNSVSSLIYSLLVFILLKFIDSSRSILSIYKKEAIAMIDNTKEMMKERLSEDEFNEQFEAFQQQYDALKDLSINDLVLDQGIGMLVTGVFLTFLFMLFLKRA